mmetsp:Transcript_21173/g.49673  ORF Transcript_21173/g.49673 Transcript_21173/m.49673 type:complete len:212 (+) Transcript_21173:590-1225(+)
MRCRVFSTCGLAAACSSTRSAPSMSLQDSYSLTSVATTPRRGFCALTLSRTLMAGLTWRWLRWSWARVSCTCSDAPGCFLTYSSSILVPSSYFFSRYNSDARTKQGSSDAVYCCWSWASISEHWSTLFMWSRSKQRLNANARRWRTVSLRSTSCDTAALDFLAESNRSRSFFSATTLLAATAATAASDGLFLRTSSYSWSASSRAPRHDWM